MSEVRRFISPYLAIAVTALLVLGYFYNHQQTEDLKDGLVASCEKNGNPLRSAVTDQLQRQINQSKAFEASGKYSLFFPGVPPHQLHALIQKQNRQLQAEIDEIAPVDCAAAFK